MVPQPSRLATGVRSSRGWLPARYFAFIVTAPAQADVLVQQKAGSLEPVGSLSTAGSFDVPAGYKKVERD